MDPYKILGVSKNATPIEIKSAYRKAAAKHHPDRGGDVWAFQQIQDAFAELTSGKPKKDLETPKAKKPKAKPTTTSKKTNTNPNRAKRSTGDQFDFSSVDAKTKRKTPKNKSRQKKSIAHHVVGTVLGAVCALLFGWFVLHFFVESEVPVETKVAQRHDDGLPNDSPRTTLSATPNQEQSRPDIEQPRPAPPDIEQAPREGDFVLHRTPLRNNRSLTFQKLKYRKAATWTIDIAFETKTTRESIIFANGMKNGFDLRLTKNGALALNLKKPDGAFQTLESPKPLLPNKKYRALVKVSPEEMSLIVPTMGLKPSPSGDPLGILL